MENIAKLLKVCSTASKNPGVKLGYYVTVAGGIVTAIVCVVTKDPSLAPYFALGPSLLLCFTVYHNYEVGKKCLRK